MAESTSVELTPQQLDARITAVKNAADIAARADERELIQQYIQARCQRLSENGSYVAAYIAGALTVLIDEIATGSYRD